MWEVQLDLFNIFFVEVCTVGIIVWLHGGGSLELGEESYLTEDSLVVAITQVAIEVLLLALAVSECDHSLSLVDEVEVVTSFTLSDDVVFWKEEHWLKVANEEALLHTWALFEEFNFILSFEFSLSNLME